jgi:hypothetical protein
VDTKEVKDSDDVVAAVQELGVLFLSDPKRKSAIQILTGEPPRGSWWSHPDADRIYTVLHRVEKHPDLLAAKLLAGKVTFIHRALWPAVLAVATAREPWQVAGLSPGAARWLAALDEARVSGTEAAQPSRTVVKEVEPRLLARGESVHSAQGTHQSRLEDWSVWAARVGATSSGISAAEGKQALESAAARLGPPPPTFPWTT